MGEDDFCGRTEFLGVALGGMKSLLPLTGTAALLRELSPHVPDAFVNQLRPRPAGCGRPRRFSPAQLYRIHLLALLTPAHSFNLLVQMLPEQRDWRRFAHLPNQRAIPDVWRLHEFRDRVGVAGWRHSNEHLLAPLLPVPSPEAWSVALMDATDLPASASGHKKKDRPLLRPAGGDRGAHAQDRAAPLLPGRQEAPLPFVARTLPARRAAGPLGDLGGTRQLERRRSVAAQCAALLAPVAVAAGRDRRGYGVHHKHPAITTTASTGYNYRMTPLASENLQLALAEARAQTR